jgi:hypothetical protein
MPAAICIWLTAKANKFNTEDQEIMRKQCFFSYSPGLLFDLGCEEGVTVDSANQIIYDAAALRGTSRPMNPPPGRSVIAIEP